MARNTEPKFTILEESQSEERAARLALFVDILRRRPEATAAILRASGTVGGVIRDSALLPEDRWRTYEGMVLCSAAQVLHHKDDLTVYTDPETSQAIATAIAEGTHGTARYDARVLRIAAFACEHAAWQDQQGPEIPDLDLSGFPEPAAPLQLLK